MRGFGASTCRSCLDLSDPPHHFGTGGNNEFIERVDGLDKASANRLADALNTQFLVQGDFEWRSLGYGERDCRRRGRRWFGFRRAVLKLNLRPQGRILRRRRLWILGERGRSGDPAHDKREQRT